MHKYDLIEENAYKLGYSEGYNECKQLIIDLVKEIHEQYKQERYTYENTMRMFSDLEIGLKEL